MHLSLLTGEGGEDQLPCARTVRDHAAQGHGVVGTRYCSHGKSTAAGTETRQQAPVHRVLAMTQMERDFSPGTGNSRRDGDRPLGTRGGLPQV
jgi:hypothetical protein